MSKHLNFLKQVILLDDQGNRAPIKQVRGAESGLKCLEIVTQSAAQAEDGVATRHRIYSEEIARD